jgi:predicted Rossmann fold flavoprotein
VVGAGAAGLVAALFAARAGADVVLLERTTDGGRKILISGGGRCNILPSVSSPERFVTASSANTLRKILRSWPLAEQRTFFETELGMALELEPETGKLFPASHRARDVRDGLLRRVREAGARVWLEAKVVDAEPREGGGWSLTIDDAPPLAASAVVLATGGLSVPATGSDGIGLAIARRLGHEVHRTYPALTPLIADPPPHRELAGVSLVATIRAPGTKPAFAATGGLLFTHRGWSGPVILDASHLAATSGTGAARQELRVGWGPPDADPWEEALRARTGTVVGSLTSRLPRRLAEMLAEESGVPADTTLAQLTRERRTALLGALCDYRLPWTGHEGYRKAEVTGGGVALGEVDPRTMESRRAPGLFLCGEMLDAFGPIGGHNFQWAWATGRAAGLGAAARIS